ncbi:MAG: hypothetical protein ACLRNW_18395, partial [Neglectibacter sp.]
PWAAPFSGLPALPFSFWYLSFLGWPNLPFSPPQISLHFKKSGRVILTYQPETHLKSDLLFPGLPLSLII